MSARFTAVLGMVGCLLLIAAPVATQAQDVPETISLDAAPTHPPAEAIDPEKLNDAAAAALRNAIASLIARQQAEGNETDLVFPPLNRRTVVDHKEVTHRYTRKVVTRTRPKFKYEYGYRLAPKKDEYGHITGYEKQRYVKKRIKIGEEKFQREQLVRDPDGDITRTRRYAVYGKGGPDYVPHGLIGLNGMALYVMVKAGLENEQATIDLADALAEAIETYALPDATFDLAWATAAFAIYPYSDHEDLHKQLVSKLIDGQVREGQGEGLWGPVAIHYDLLARYMLLEIKLYQEISPLREQLDKIVVGNEDGELSRREARMKAILEKKLGEYQVLLDEVNKGLHYTSVLGKRFAKVEAEYRPTDEWGKAGLPYYIYNRVLADHEATALAAFALATSAEAGRLPDMTIRREPTGNPLSPPENTRASLMQSLRRIVQQQQRHGGWDEGNMAIVNRTFDRFRAVGVQDVPFRGDLPELPNLETIRSNLDGYAALTALLETWGDRAPAAFSRGRERAFDHVAAAVEALLAKPIEFPDEALAYAGETDTVDELTGIRGRLATDARATSDPAEMPVSFWPDGVDLMRSASVFLTRHEGLTSEQADRLKAMQRRLAYRLVMTQREDGQWHGQSKGRAASSSLRQYIVFDKAPRLTEWAEKHPDRKRTPNWWRDERRQNIWVAFWQGREFEAPNHVYPTLAASLVLLDLVDEPVSLADAAILPPEPEEEEGPAEEVAEAEEAEGEEPEPLTPEAAASSVERFNEALLPLVEAVISYARPDLGGGDPDAGEAGEPADGDGHPEGDDAAGAAAGAEPAR